MTAEQKTKPPWLTLVEIDDPEAPEKIKTAGEHSRQLLNKNTPQQINKVPSDSKSWEKLVFVTSPKE